MRSLLALALLLGACAHRSKPAVETAATATDPATASPAATSAHGDEGAAAHADALRSATIYFAYDEDGLDARARGALEQAADALRGAPAARLRIAGHTDERGTEEYNLALGDRRAQAARKHVERLGVDAARIDTVSFGESHPAVAGENEAAWSRNRRAELELQVP
jgi:peptidoglycan-associated lipoprotein